MLRSAGSSRRLPAAHYIPRYRPSVRLSNARSHSWARRWTCANWSLVVLRSTTHCVAGAIRLPCKPARFSHSCVWVPAQPAMDNRPIGRPGVPLEAGEREQGLRTSHTGETQARWRVQLAAIVGLIRIVGDWIAGRPDGWDGIRSMAGRLCGRLASLVAWCALTHSVSCVWLYNQLQYRIHRKQPLNSGSEKAWSGVSTSSRRFFLLG